MEQISKRRRYNIALEMGVLYSIIILLTFFRRVPGLLALLQRPGSGAWKDHGALFMLGEAVFISAGLVAFYGLISLWLADLRFILWSGLGLVVLAGLIYLAGAVTCYQTQGLGPAIPQGAAMFLLSLLIPILTGNLLMRFRSA
jgi:hypothetical protein